LVAITLLVLVKFEKKFDKMALVKAFGLPALLTKTFQSLTLSQNRVLSTSTNLGISVTPVTFGLPTKRKKKADPIEVRRKEEKRKLRLKKALRKLGKKERLPKPLSRDSIEPPLHLLKQRDIRARQDLTPITEEIEEERIEIIKEWGKFSSNRHRQEIQQIDKMLYS
jgi:hypothetical protein